MKKHDMILSRDRILTTHVGSLPRSEALSEMLIDREEGKPLNPRELADEMDRAVRHVIAKQAEAGPAIYARTACLIVQTPR